MCSQATRSTESCLLFTNDVCSSCCRIHLDQSIIMPPSCMRLWRGETVYRLGNFRWANSGSVALYLTKLRDTRFFMKKLRY